jgi:purine-nucleoside phosphorylase
MVGNRQKAAAYLRSAGIQSLSGAISTGSGQTLRLEPIRERLHVGYGGIPGFGELELPGHEGFLSVIEGTDGLWAIWTGRRHFYQGFSYDEIGLYIDISHELGAGSLLVLNAAGGLDPDMKVGDLALIERYRNFIPFRGYVLPVEGEYWRETSETLASRIQRVAEIVGVHLRSGSYAGVSGPTYETEAEVAWLRGLGCDVVGMSTVPELERAVEHEMEAAALSLIANVHGRGMDVTHEEVVRSGKAGADLLSELVKGFLGFESGAV